MGDNQTLEHDTAAMPWRRQADDRSATERAHAMRVALLRAQYETARIADLGAAAEFDD